MQISYFSSCSGLGGIISCLYVSMAAHVCSLYSYKMHWCVRDCMTTQEAPKDVRILIHAHAIWPDRSTHATTFLWFGVRWWLFTCRVTSVADTNILDL